MSMNINLVAEQNGQFVFNGTSLPHTIREYFNCWQTPTDITKRIINSEKPREEYETWVKKVASSKESATYHLKQLDKWIHKHEGFTLEWFEM